jgi:hypothetical protein
MSNYFDKAIIYNKKTKHLEIIKYSNKMDEIHISEKDKDFCLRQINGTDFNDCSLTMIDKNIINETIQDYMQYYGQYYDSESHTDEETTFELDVFNVTKRYLNIKLPYVNSIVFYYFEYNTTEYLLK